MFNNGRMDTLQKNYKIEWRQQKETTAPFWMKKQVAEWYA